MRILIIGFGSIGKRHCQNLKALGYEDVYIYDKIPNSKFQIPNKFQITNFKPKILKQFDVVFICTPNHLHVKYALLAAKASCHLFIEKPLSHNLSGVNQLIKLVRLKKLVNMVACNMRFHPATIFAKKYIDQGKLGQIYRIDHEYGSYLPDWRAEQDYRKNYAAKKASGGGIILDDIHEFDLLFWLNDFAEVKEAKFVYDRVSRLEIETEDVCVAGFKFANKMIGSVRCDYLQRSESRTCKIVGERGNLEIDLLKNTVWLKTERSEKKLFALKRNNDNEDYVAEIKYFLSCVKKGQKTFNDIARAREVLKYCVNR